nr:MAG TPA_asm: hypothetical protein [Caudoviricetes sp.]
MKKAVNMASNVLAATIYLAAFVLSWVLYFIEWLCDEVEEMNPRLQGAILGFWIALGGMLVCIILALGTEKYI